MIPKQAGHLHDLYQSGGQEAAALPTILQLQSPLRYSGALTPLLYVDIFCVCWISLLFLGCFPNLMPVQGL